MNCLQSIDDFHKQLKDSVSLSRDIKLFQKPNAIVVCGMGTGGNVGDIITSLGCTVPVIVNKSDELPLFIDKNTVVFCISYAGTDIETIQCAQEALKKNARLVIITSGGKLLKLAQENSTTIFQLPADSQWALGLMLMPVLLMLVKNGMVKTTMDDISTTIAMLAKTNLKEKAADIATNIGQKTPVIYAPTSLSGAATHIKESINTIAKTEAYANVFPELNHAEMHAVQKAMHAIILRDEKESAIVQQSINTFKKQAKEKQVQYTELMLRGERQFNKIMLAILFGEYIAYYLAQRNGILE